MVLQSMLRVLNYLNVQYTRSMSYTGECEFFLALFCFQVTCRPIISPSGPTKRIPHRDKLCIRMAGIVTNILIRIDNASEIDGYHSLFHEIEGMSGDWL